jgi:phage shock protein PspC (stress-responsive transcriptional regulator)
MSIKDVIEQRAFGVCHHLGERMGIQSSVVRRYFIYVSFITMGSPLIVYLVAAFWLNVRTYIRKNRNPIWY